MDLLASGLASQASQEVKKREPGLEDVLEAWLGGQQLQLGEELRRAPFPRKPCRCKRCHFHADRLEAPQGTGLHAPVTVQPRGKKGATYGKEPKVTRSARQDAAIRDLSDVPPSGCTPLLRDGAGGRAARGGLGRAPGGAAGQLGTHMVPPVAVRLCGEQHVLEGEGPVRLVLMAGCRAAELLRAGCHKRDFLCTVRNLSQTMLGEPFQAVAMRNPKELGFPVRWGGGSDDGGSDDGGTGGEIVAAGSNGGRESELPEGEAGADHLPGYAPGYAAGVREGLRAGVGAGEKKAPEEIQKRFNEVGTMVAANESTGRAYATLRLLLGQERNPEGQAAPEAPPARNRVPDDWAEKLGANSAGMDCGAVMLEVLVKFGSTVEAITEKKLWQQVGKELLTRGGWTALAEGKMAGHTAKQAFEQHFNYDGLVQHRERRHRRRVVLKRERADPGNQRDGGRGHADADLAGAREGP